MATLDVLLRKEDINEQSVRGNVTVVFDILLATSTITSMFHHGAQQIMPVMNGEEGLSKKREAAYDDFMLVGEYRGRTIEGFLAPYPTTLKEQVHGRNVIFTTTNGTVALRNSWPSEAVYAGSMLNEEILTDYLVHTYKGQAIMLVCSGSSGQFNLEDFYGVGSFIKALLAAGNRRGVAWELSDAAVTALHFYKANEHKGEELLKKSRVGNKLTNEGHQSEVRYVLQKNACPVIPRLDGDLLKLVRWQS